MKSLILFFILVSSMYANIAKVTAVSGKAVIIRDTLEIPVKKDLQIEEKDVIKTMPKSKLQLIFSDQTMISLGQKTVFEVEEYLFSNTKVKAKFKISKGLFKSITGKIGKIAPKNFQLKTQNATIGIRGTTIIGEVSKESDTIICSSGQIVVSTPKGEVVVSRGEKTVAKKTQAPAKVVKVSLKSIAKLEKSMQVSEKKAEKKRDNKRKNY